MFLVAISCDNLRMTRRFLKLNYLAIIHVSYMLLCLFVPSNIAMVDALDRKLKGDASIVCSTPIYWSGYRNVSISVNGEERSVALFIPWNDRGKTQVCGSNQTPQTYCTGPPLDPAPLVINWHGCNAHGPILDYHTEISQMSIQQN